MQGQNQYEEDEVERLAQIAISTCAGGQIVERTERFCQLLLVSLLAGIGGNVNIP